MQAPDSAGSPSPANKGGAVSIDVVKRPDVQAGGNVSSTIMYQIPTASLPSLREDFDKSQVGLTLIVFLNVMVKTMALKTEPELLKIIPDLVDFFKSVDINGDGKMEWSEFVMFVIESVVVVDQAILEQVTVVEHSLIQTAACRHPVRVTKILPEFNRLFIGMGPQILIFQPDDHSNTWLDKGVKLQLTHRALEDENVPKPAVRQPKDDRQEKSLQCLDFCFLGAKEMLLVLRSDMSLEFHRFMTRSKVAADLIQQNGFWVFEQPYHKMALRQMSSSRSSTKIPWRVFLIAESRNTIDSWTVSVGSTGVIQLTEKMEFNLHTDYVTDILVVDWGFFHYFVSCGMDQKVYIYDLATLQHKYTRTGFNAGVCCLAFDNRSLIFAGGFDYNIIAWDLDAEIDRPIFQLWGHKSPITKIVSMGNINRAASIDSSGCIFFWDTSKTNPNDKEARQIDNISYVDDTLRSFEIFQGVNSNFSTAHQIFMAAQGRRQHVYKIADLTPKESPPVARGVLFSASLLMMVTVHSQDVLFFSAVTGGEQKKMNRAMMHLEGLGNEAMSAVLDDRERKLIVGEAGGTISVYNMLSGVRLKRSAINIPYAIRDMIYTKDKTIIALAGPGELYIFDELPNEEGKDTTLRYIQAHEVDVTCMCFSYEMSLIATADCTGCIRVFDYEFLNIVINFDELIGTDIGQITFIDKYPLLLITDSNNNFTIVTVGKAYQAMGRKVWRVENIATDDPDSLMHNMTYLNPVREPESAHTHGEQQPTTEVVKKVSRDDEVALTDAAAEEEKETDEAAHKKDRDKDKKNPEINSPSMGGARVGSPTGGSIHTHSSAVGAANGKDEAKVIELEDEDEEEGGPNKPFKLKQMKEFLEGRRSSKSICVVVQKSEELRELERFEQSIVDETDEVRLMQLLGSNPNDDKDEKDSQASSSEDEEEEDEVDPRREELLKSTCISTGFPLFGERVFVLCGTDDGHVMVVDLTTTLREIDVGHLMSHEWVPNRKTYDPRRLAYSPNIKESELASFTWYPKEIALGTEHTTGHVSLVWAPHVAAITTIYMLGTGDDSRRDILTAGQDQAVYTWFLTGAPKATLTRGRDWDKLFKPRWKSPVDMEERRQRREKDAHILCDALGLTRYMRPVSSAAGLRDDGMGHGANVLNKQRLDAQNKAIAEAEARDRGKKIKKAGELGGIRLSGSEGERTLSRSTSKNTEKMNFENGSIHDSMVSKGSGKSRSTHLSREDETENARVIGQLRGRITYQQSNKDRAAGVLGLKHSQSMEMIASIGKPVPEGKKKKVGPFDIAANEEVVRTESGLWLDDVMDGASGIGVEVGLKHANGKKNPNKNGPGESRPRKIKTKYDLELAAIEELDPHNWEINSTNRQRALYGRLYQELDKVGVVKDNNAMFEHKLNKLSGGNFRSFVARIWEERSMTGSEASRKKCQEGLANDGIQTVSQDKIDQISYRVNILASSLDNDSSVLQIEHTGILLTGQIVSDGKPKLTKLTKTGLIEYDAASIDYDWTQNLRTPIYANPYASNKDGLPADKKANSQYIAEHKLTLGPVSGATSPIKLSAVQLRALQERKVVLELRDQFEKHLEQADKMARQAKKICRKKRREHRNLVAQVQAASKLSAVDRLRASIRGQFPVDVLDLSLDKLHRLRQPDTRHLMASLAELKTQTIDDVIDVTRKKKHSEDNWQRKVNLIVFDEEEEASKAKTTKSFESNSLDDVSLSSSVKRGRTSDDEIAKRDKKILAKRDFGPYKVQELFKLLRCFQSLPSEEPEEDSLSARSLGSDSVISVRAGEPHPNEVKNFNLGGYYANNAANNEYDDGGDWPTDEEELERRQKEQEEALLKLEETSEMLEERARQEEERKKQIVEQMARETEAKHAVHVVTSNVRLLALLEKPFIKMNSQFKNELTKQLNRRSEDGTLPRNVLINLTDVLSYCCSYMQPQEKAQCLRYFVLKTPRTVDLIEAIEKGLTREQLKKLKKMFEFFDKDGSGGIDKFEIVEVLEKLANNKKKDFTSDKLNDDEDKGVELSDAEALIASVQGHDAEELDFDSFIIMFKSLV